MPWHTQIFADQLTLFQPGGAGYVRHINTCPSRFSELPPALSLIAKTKLTLKRIPAELNASPVLNLKNVDVFLSTPHNSGETLRQPQEISSPKIKLIRIIEGYNENQLGKTYFFAALFIFLYHTSS